MAGDGDGNYGRGLAVGLEVAVGVGLGYVVGSWIDRKTGHGPWGMLAGILVGCAAGMYLLIKEAMRDEKP